MSAMAHVLTHTVSRKVVWSFCLCSIQWSSNRLAIKQLLHISHVRWICVQTTLNIPKSPHILSSCSPAQTLYVLMCVCFVFGQCGGWRDIWPLCVWWAAARVPDHSSDPTDTGRSPPAPPEQLGAPGLEGLPTHTCTHTKSCVRVAGM